MYIQKIKKEDKREEIDYHNNQVGDQKEYIY
jgi:hypothetical protein